jgi:hypothetical protein
VQIYTKCAVLNPFVPFLKHKCAVTKLTKIALKQSSHLLVTLVDAPEISRIAVITIIKNINVFWGRTPDPPIFLINHLRAGVMENKVKLGRARLPKRD